MADSDIILIDSDISATSLGDVLLVSGDGEMIQSAINRMRLIYSEWFGNPRIGNMISTRRLKLNDRSMKQVEYDCMVAILQDPRVIDVPYISAVRTVGYDCMVNFKMKKSDGSIIGSDTLITLRG